MKRKNVYQEYEEEFTKAPLSERFLKLILYYLIIGWNDLKSAMSNLTEPDKRRLLFGKIKTFVLLFHKKAVQEGILKEAAALTYITILGFIPFLLVIVFLLPKLTMFVSHSKLNQHLYENLMPVSTSEVGNILSQLISRQTTFNIFSLIIAVITSYSLFKVIRDTFDRILVMEYQPPKDLLSQLLKFFGTIIFGFVIILLLFSSSSLPIISSLLNIPLFHGVLITLLPFVVQFLALLFLYMILPSIKVNRGALFRGVFWTTLLWVLAKSIFDYYIYNLTNIEAVYGVLKSLPIFLFWIYFNWVIILGGMVLVTILEHKEKALDYVDNKHYVRVTLEMYTNKKKMKEVDTLLGKQSVPELIEKLIEEEKE